MIGDNAFEAVRLLQALAENGLPVGSDDKEARQEIDNAAQCIINALADPEPQLPVSTCNHDWTHPVVQCRLCKGWANTP